MSGRRVVPWCGVIGFTETPSTDGRVLDWVLWETPLPVTKRIGRGPDRMPRLVGRIDRIIEDGCVLRGEGSIFARYAGKEFTGGIDVNTSPGLVAPAVDNAGFLHLSGVITGFVIDDRPAWAGVRLIVEQSPTPSKLGETA